MVNSHPQLVIAMSAMAFGLTFDIRLTELV